MPQPFSNSIGWLQPNCMLGADHRTLTIPLVVGGAVALVAGLLGALVAATTTIAVANPLGMAGVGLVCLVAGLAVNLAKTRPAPGESYPIPPEPRTKRGLLVGAAGGVLVVAMLLLAAFGPGASLASFLSEGTEGDAAVLEPAAAADPALPLATEEFTGTLQGLSLPVLGGAGTASVTHDVAATEGAAAMRLELAWTAGSGGASELALRLEAEVDGAWEEVASGQGGPGLVVDADALPAGATAYRAVVSLPSGSGTPSQAYTLYASSFAGAIPEGFAHGHEE